jgi:hypothetical protein
LKETLFQSRTEVWIFKYKLVHENL